VCRGGDVVVVGRRFLFETFGVSESFEFPFFVFTVLFIQRIGRGCFY
jgi:hypothetical protein